MNNLLEKYKTWLITNGLSNATIRAYMQKIRFLFKELDNVNNLNEDTIRKFLVSIQEQKTISTCNLYKQGIKSFITFIKLNIDIPKNAKVEKVLPEFITEDYFENEVIKNIVERVVNNPIKIKAILYFMFYTGLRIGELANIKREDINLKDKIVKVRIPKTKEERMVFFNNKVVYFLKTYFITENQKNNLFNMTTGGITELFRRLNVYFKDINFHPHLLRHSYGTHLRKTGMKIEDIKELMGHKSISTTMRYAHADMKDLREKYDKSMK